MTARHLAPLSAAPVEQFPERPPRMDMQNVLYLALPGHHTALIRHLGTPAATLVIGEMPVRRRTGAQAGLLYPDLMVAFGVDSAALIALGGFDIDDVGKPPEFVLEVASFRTALNDYTVKRIGYAAFGIPEYWRFDPTGGDRYPAPLAGDRLADGEYQPITIVQTDEGGYWGRSEVLNLSLCWENGQLRWHDPVSQSYLLTHDEAEEQRTAERDARIAAEARIRQLEEELRRSQ